MANGITHNRYGWAGVISVSAISIFLECDICKYGIISGAIFAHLIDPDVLDQHQVTTDGERRIGRAIGKIPQLIIWLWVFPLAKIIPHRHPTSHWPPLNTVLRILYVLGPLLLFLYYNDIAFNAVFIIYMLVGGIPIDTIHLLLDTIRKKKYAAY